jgi:nucleoside 2-deoxyribosyltransferase
MKKKPRSRIVYFAGELFSLQHLIGNAHLAEGIYERSHGKYLCQLPQDFEHKGVTARSIRDQDIRALISSDLALFNFDGTEIDAGTLAVFMMAKMADIPAVILRSDVRGTGTRNDPWNLMAMHYPRTIIVMVDALRAYKSVRKRHTRRPDPVMRLAAQQSSADTQRLCDDLAAACTRALDRVGKLEPVMPKHLREEVYNWLALMPGLRGKEKALRKEFERCLERKVDLDLL